MLGFRWGGAEGFFECRGRGTGSTKYEMTLRDITHPNSDAAVRLIAGFTITPRQIAERLAHIENQTRTPDASRVTWQEMIVSDPTGLMRPAGEIVAEGRAYQRERIAIFLRAARRSI